MLMRFHTSDDIQIQNGMKLQERKITIWAIVEGLSQIARGISRNANGDSIIWRYVLTYPTIFRKYLKWHQ